MAPRRAMGEFAVAGGTGSEANADKPPEVRRFAAASPAAAAIAPGFSLILDYMVSGKSAEAILKDHAPLAHEDLLACATSSPRTLCGEY